MNRLPPCQGLTHKEIWRLYKELYQDLDERQLREIHLRWVKAWADAGCK